MKTHGLFNLKYQKDLKMKSINGKVLETISGGDNFNQTVVAPIGVAGMVNPDNWGARINANLPINNNTYISPNVIYSDQIGFVNPGIQITHILD